MAYIGITLDPESGSQKATLVVLVVVVSYLRVQKSRTKLCIHIHADIAHKSAVSDFSLIF